MYEKLAYALVPSGYKANKLYSFVGGDLTFTRATTATRINKDGYIEFVPTGVPRLNYPIINGKVSNIPELLLEPARTNFQVYSEDFSNAAWSKTGSTIDTDPIVAPDGNLAYAMRETTATSEHRVSDAYTSFDGSSSYTFSVFAKHNGTRLLNLFSGTSSRFAINANFDLVNGVVYSSPTGTATIEKYPNGWYRCSATGVSASSGSSTLVIRHKDESLNTSFAGDLNEATYLWGAQLELGEYSTSYIPTFDSTASRNAETSIEGDGDFNSFEGVLYAEIAPNADELYTRYLSVSDGTSTNKVEIYYSNTSQRLAARLYRSSAIVTLTYDFATLDAYLESSKIAFKYKKDDFALWVNGVEVDTETSGDTFSAGVLTEFNFNDGSGNEFYGRVKQVLIFNEALTDSELETLTT